MFDQQTESNIKLFKKYVEQIPSIHEIHKGNANAVLEALIKAYLGTASNNFMVKFATSTISDIFKNNNNFCEQLLLKLTDTNNPNDWIFELEQHLQTNNNIKKN